MTPEDSAAVLAAARSYRPGALMTVEDILIAARVDGHPLDHADGRAIAAVLRRAGARPISLTGSGHLIHWILEAGQ